jgi:hypothetical protein
MNSRPTSKRVDRIASTAFKTRKFVVVETITIIKRLSVKDLLLLLGKIENANYAQFSLHFKARAQLLFYPKMTSYL